MDCRLIGWLAGWFVDRSVGCLVTWLVFRFVCLFYGFRLVGWLAGWFVGCLFGWLAGWFVGWLFGYLVSF